MNARKEHLMKRPVTRRIFPVLIVASFALMGVGCSTVSGFADLTSGIARDIKDAAEGSRDKSAQRGELTGTYGSR